MHKTLNTLLLFVTLVFFWLWLNVSLASDVIIAGLVVSFVIALIFRHRLSVLADLRFTPRALAFAVLYFPYFIKELVKSNINVAKIVLSPKLSLNPGIVKVRTKLKSRLGRLLLANSITLTPGTLTVELSDEWLYIHWITVDSPDIEGATASIVAGFEYYLEAIYG